MELFLFLTAYYFYILDWSLFISFTLFIKMCVFSKLVYYLTYNNNLFYDNILYDYIRSFYLGIQIIKVGLGDTFRYFPLTNNLLIRYEYLNIYFKQKILQKIVINFYQLAIYLISKIIMSGTPNNDKYVKSNVSHNYNNLHDDKDVDNFLNDLSHLNMATGS
jgi:hypothetical protein